MHFLFVTNRCDILFMKSGKPRRSCRAAQGVKHLPNCEDAIKIRFGIIQYLLTRISRFRRAGDTGISDTCL